MTCSSAAECDSLSKPHAQIHLPFVLESRAFGVGASLLQAFEFVDRGRQFGVALGDLADEHARATRIAERDFVLCHRPIGRRQTDAGLRVTERVHRLRRAQHHQPHRFDVDARPRQDLHVLAEIDQLLAEAFATHPAIDHHLDRTLGGTDRAHAVVNATWSESQL